MAAETGARNSRYHFREAPFLKSEQFSTSSREHSQTDGAEKPVRKREDVTESSTRSLRQLMVQFADETTVQGPRFIKDSHTCCLKILWSAIFAAVLGMCIFHNYYLLSKYLAYQASAAVTSQYDVLDFPSVTICNVNVMLKSKLQMYASDDMRQYIGQVEPGTSYRPGYVQNSGNSQWSTQTQSGTQGSAPVKGATQGFTVQVASETTGPSLNASVSITPAQGVTTTQTTTPVRSVTTTQTTTPVRSVTTTQTTTPVRSVTTTQTTTPARGVTTTQTTTHASGVVSTTTLPTANTGAAGLSAVAVSVAEETSSVSTNGSPTTEQPNSTTNYVLPRAKRSSQNNNNNNNSSSSSMQPPAALFGGGQTASDVKVSQNMMSLYSYLPDQNRTALGHNLSQMLLDCSFNGLECSPANFTLFSTSDLGNCYTFNSAAIRNVSLKSQTSGALYGLSLKLYTQYFQYTSGANSGAIGFQFDIHKFGTRPSPSATAYSVGPGTQTGIGLKMISTSLLGGKYGKCGDGGDYEAYYDNKYSYTMQGCSETCLDRMISKNCGCYIAAHYHGVSEKDTNSLHWCVKDNSTQTCADEYVYLYNTGQLDCGCSQACSSVQYDLLSTNKKWPTDDQWFDLVNSVCARVDSDECQEFMDRTPYSAASDNFLTLKIYYRDLNYAVVEESPDYALEQYISDVGGAMGLWLGATVVTLAELISLFVNCGMLGLNGHKTKSRNRTFNELPYNSEKRLDREPRFNANNERIDYWMFDHPTDKYARNSNLRDNRHTGVY